ncbi:MAG: FeoC-like transcriptional regulator [Anaerolineae bacterium]|nr:FeoC-like transcriptional regulator [Anaerolineae bacterium]MDW8068395.1 FeoC-like transcriptional regulator [Anaerolineae bacterium]
MNGLLERLLEILQAGGTHRVSDLAHMLDTTPALVEMMLEELARAGYVKPIAACAEPCTACPLTDSCIPAQAGKAWVLARF